MNETNGKPTFSNTVDQIQIHTLEKNGERTAANSCITCMQSTRAVAFVPCAHYVTCLPCGHGETECPVCKSKIMACVRIYE